jgi:hypothetical protein
MEKSLEARQTPLSIFVRNRLAELGIRQSEFCRLTSFDQGLLSKIHSSMVSSLSLESTLRLALGLSVHPRELLQLMNRIDLHDLVTRSYSAELNTSSPVEGNGAELPKPVVDICNMAFRAYSMGRDLTPILKALQPMIAVPVMNHRTRAVENAF